eukprot:Gb_19281 [translate_table: standard]
MSYHFGQEKKGEKKEEKKEEIITVVMKVYMHCEGCAGQVEKCLKGYEGVEYVEVDMKNNKVTVKGKVEAKKICERVEKKSRKKTELISPLPKKDDGKKPEAKEQKPEEKKEKQPTVVTVVVKVLMHCEACAQKLKRIVLKMKGVHSAEPDFKTQKFTVKGTIDPKDLVEYIYKKAKKRAEIVPPKKEEKKGDDGKGGDQKKEDGKKSEDAAPKYVIEYVHAPQLFSDENPNACSIM